MTFTPSCFPDAGSGTDQGVVALRAHVAERPRWSCVACGAPWPCPESRTVLLAEHQGATVSLFWFLALCLIDAINDFFQHSRQPAPDLYDRFLGWVRETDPGASTVALYEQTAPIPGEGPDSRHEVNLR